jgi:hypothetical protein
MTDTKSMLLWEALRALQVDGAKIRHVTMGLGQYLDLHSSDGIVCRNGVSSYIPPLLGGWEIYEEPVEMFGFDEALKRYRDKQTVARRDASRGGALPMTQMPSDPNERTMLNMYDIEATDWMVVK